MNGRARTENLWYVPGMKPFLVDTTTTIVFFTLIAAFSELIVVGMDPQQVLVTRAITVPVMVLTGRPYGLWRDWIIGFVETCGRTMRLVVDTIAFLTFQVPVYVVTLLVVGADVSEIVMATASATMFMLIIGRPFGLCLDVIRRWSGTASA